MHSVDQNAQTPNAQTPNVQNENVPTRSLSGRNAENPDTQTSNVRTGSAPARNIRRVIQGALATAAFATAVLALAGCGNSYRPVVTAINPVGPAVQPTKYAVVISSNGSSSNGLVTLVDFAGDTVLDTTTLGVDPYYLMLNVGGTQGYTLNRDGTLNTFAVSTTLRQNNVLESTLLAGSNPTAIYDQGTSLYISTPGRSSVGQFTNVPPALRQELPTGPGTVYTVGAANAPRAYALVEGTSPSQPGVAAAIETSTNTISADIPVGIAPVYGVMTADTRRAFVLNNGSGTVTVINAQTNALDTFTNTSNVVTSTIPVGTSPVWADLAPTLAELVVANAGDGISSGSVSIVSIPLCSVTTAPSNPACDPANPVDAVGFGTVVANVPVGVNPVMVAVLQDGSRAYVANAGNPAAGVAGSISVINLTTNTVTATLAAGPSVDPNDNLIHGHPTFIAVTTGNPTGKVYVTSSDSPDLTIIRTDTDSVQTHLPLQGNGVMVRVTRP